MQESKQDTIMASPWIRAVTLERRDTVREVESLGLGVLGLGSVRDRETLRQLPVFQLGRLGGAIC